jgi:hypothetical protein
MLILNFGKSNISFIFYDHILFISKFSPLILL